MKATLDPKSFTIATFALCGFANFSSIAIQIGGIGRWRLAGRAIWRGWGCGRSRRVDGEFHECLYCGMLL